MASSPARPFASPLQRSSQGSPSMSSPTSSIGTSPLEPGAGGGPLDPPPRLAQLSTNDQVAFSVFPLEGPSGQGDVRWRCFQAVSGTKDEAVSALDTLQRSVAGAWSSVGESDELEEGQEPPVYQHLFSRSLLSALVPFSPKAFVKAPPQAPQPQPPQPSPESMGGPQATSPTEVLTGKEDGGEIWVFDVRTTADAFNALDTLHEGLPDCLRETSSGSFKVSDVFPPLPVDPRATSTSLASLFPAVHLRKLYPLFLRAARERMVAHLVQTSTAHSSRSRAVKCGDKVLLYTGQVEDDTDLRKTGREWGEAWTSSAATEADRTVLCLTFALDLLPSPHHSFLFVPHLQRLPSIPLAFHPQRRHFSANPPPKPVPVRLLPLDIPAFYLRPSNTSPSNADSARYWSNLADSGAVRPEAGKEDWAVCWVPAPDDVGMKSGTTLSWDTRLILVESSAISFTVDRSPQPTVSKLKPTKAVPHPSGRPTSQPPASGFGSLTDSWRRLTSRSAHHFAPTLPSPPDSTEPSSPRREIVEDEYEEVALATGAYLEGVVKARELEREQAEADRERERSRKEGVDVDTPVVAHPTAPDSPDGSDDLWGSPPPPAAGQDAVVVPRSSSTTLHLPAVAAVPTIEDQPVVPPTDVNSPLPPASAPTTSVFDPGGEIMDWSWDAPAGSSTGGMRGFGVDPLSGLPDEGGWGGPDQVTEDDFDFFDAAPIGGHHPVDDHPFDNLQQEDLPASAIETMAVRPDAQQVDSNTSYVDPTFSLSPMPHFAPPEGEGESHDFTLSQLIDADMAVAPSPLDFATFNTQGGANTVGPPPPLPPAHSPHPTAPSPASWLAVRTPKTPKTPFSPFVDVVEEEDDVDDLPIGGRNSQTSTSFGPPALYIPPGFETVVFGKAHAEADAKYGVGKFGFPAVQVRDGTGDPQASRKALLHRRLKRRQLSFERMAFLPFKLLYARASTPESEGEEEDAQSLKVGLTQLDIRSVYDQTTDPRLGVVARIKKQQKRKRIDVSVEQHDRLPKKISRRSAVSRDAPFHRSPAPEGQDLTDDEDEDDVSVIRFEGPRSTAGGPEIDLNLQNRRDEVDPPIGQSFVAQLKAGAFPSDHVPLPSTVARSTYTYGPPPSISTPMPLSALTPGPMAVLTPAPLAASTPAWAPTPTSPPFMPPPAKEFSKEAIASFTSWALDEVVSNPAFYEEVLLVGREDRDSVQDLRDDLSAARQSFQLQSASLSKYLAPSPLRLNQQLVRSFPRPKLAVGFQGKILKVTSEALPFWQKIRLEPVGGKKDVAAFVVYESTGAGLNACVSKWLANIGREYETLGFGRHVAASLGGVQNGLVAVEPHQLAEVLRPIVSQLGDISHAVLYVLTPPDFLTPNFDLREVQQQLSDVLSSRRNQVVAQFISYGQVLDPPLSTSPYHALAQTVYDRLNRRVERLVPRRIFVGDAPVAFIPFPAFHLARSHPPALQFQLKWPAPPLNLLDHHAFLHAAYALSADGEWVYGFLTDERGQGQQSFSVRLDGGSLRTAVREVYERALGFATRANTEWRVVFNKLGLMGTEELEIWDDHLSSETPDENQALQIFLACSVQQPARPFLLCDASLKTAVNPTSPSFSTTSTAQNVPSATPFALDSTRTGELLFPSYRRPIVLNADNKSTSIPSSILPLATFSAVHSSSANSQPTSTLSAHLLLVDSTPNASTTPPTSNFTALNQELADSHHALTLLSQHRWHIPPTDSIGQLPLHLAAVARMSKAHQLLAHQLLP